MATLPAQTRRFKLYSSAILRKNSSDLFLDAKGLRTFSGFPYHRFGLTF